MARRTVTLVLAAMTLAGCRKAAAPEQHAPTRGTSSPAAVEASLGTLARDSVAQDAAQFTQAFYDWYAVHETNLDTAVKLRPEVFGPELLRALRGDIAASSHSPNEVVGLDWDPLTGSQDPCLPMKVDVVTRRGDTLLVAMRGMCTDAEPRSTPDALPELLHTRSGWVFVDIRHGSDTGSLLHDLAQFQRERDSAATRHR